MNRKMKIPEARIFYTIMKDKTFPTTIIQFAGTEKS